MGVIYRNDCNGCADCQHCGLDKDYPVLYCDRCGEEQNEDESIYRYNNRDYCKDCLIKVLLANGEIYEVMEDDDE